MNCDFDVRNKILHIIRGKGERGDITLFITEQIADLTDMRDIILLIELEDSMNKEKEVIIKLICQDFSKIVRAIGFKFESSGVFYTFEKSSLKSAKKAIKNYPEFMVFLKQI